MPALLQFLFLFSVILACLGFMHLIPNKLIFWVSLVLSAAYAAMAIVLPSTPAAIMAAYFAGCAYLRVALRPKP